MMDPKNFEEASEDEDQVKAMNEELDQIEKNSTWELVLLRREIPMAWGTTTDSLTPEINLSQYAI